MVNYCVVRGCKRESYPGCGISFHKIPADEERRDLWIKAMRLKTNVAKCAFVCGRHFNDEDYFSKPNPRLKPNAVPSILPMVVPVIKNVVLRANKLEVGVSDSDDSMTPDDTTHEAPSDLSGYHEAAHSSDDFEILDEPSVKKLKLVDIGTQTQKMPVSPETEKLRQDIKVLRQRLRRYETKIVNLKTILDVVLKKKKMKIIRS